jgi:hypothetical protein
MSCNEKIQLVTAYEAAKDLFLAARDRLLQDLGVSPREAYEEMKQAADQAQLASETARLALEKHSASHGC